MSKTVAVKYEGPHDEVELAATGQTVKRGEAIEVAEDLGKSLLKQDTWESATKVAARKDEV